MANRDEELLTVEAARAWLQATKADREREEARFRATMVHQVLDLFVSRVRWGLTPQAAGDEVWRMRGKHAPHDVQRIVIETLEGVGWIRSARKVTGD